MQHGIEPFDASRIAEALRGRLALPASLDPEFDSALQHVLGNPGSLVRPRLAFQMATAYGLDSGRAQDLAIALEYFHTASLLLDDLPCMDNALERRGAPCTHLLYGEDGAILVALALINRAYALTWRTVAACPPPAQQRALDYVERRLGIEGLLNGQSLDLHFASVRQTREATERVAMGKTVSLIRLTLALPAMLGNASPHEIRHIERIAIFWGLGYQIADDLKDMLDNPGQSGKTPARDMLLGRPNLAAVIGIPAAAHRLTRLIDLGDRVLQRLLALRPAVAFLEKLRSDLQLELARILRNSCELAERSRA